MAYIPHFQNQHANFPNPLPSWYVKAKWTYDDCWVRVTSWVVDGGTGGQTVPTVVTLRTELSKLGNRVADGPGGINDVSHGASKSGVNFTVREMSIAQARRILTTAAPGTYIAAPTDYREFPKAGKCDPSFAGRHMVGVIPGANGKSFVKVMNPLCSGYKMVPVDGLLRSMELYAKDHGRPAGTVSLGFNSSSTPPPSGNGGGGGTPTAVETTFSPDTTSAWWTCFINKALARHEVLYDPNNPNVPLTDLQIRDIKDCASQFGLDLSKYDFTGLSLIAFRDKLLADKIIPPPTPLIPNILGGLPDAIQWLGIIFIGLVLLAGGIFLLKNNVGAKKEATA